MSSSLDQKVLEIVQEAEAEEQGQPKDDGNIHLGNGTVLLPKGVPPLLAQKVESKFKYPPVPVLFNEEKDRKEENPNDPDYIAACEQVDLDKGMALIDLLVGLGTVLIRLPDSIPGPDSDEWVGDVEYYLGEPIPNSRKVRYLYWLKYVAVEVNEDLQLIARKVSAKMGVPESAVGAAMSQLKSDEERGTDTEGDPS
jgi:hypothetical protein